MPGILRQCTAAVALKDAFYGNCRYEGAPEGSKSGNQLHDRRPPPLIRKHIGQEELSEEPRAQDPYPAGYVRRACVGKQAREQKGKGDLHVAIQ